MLSPQPKAPNWVRTHGQVPLANPQSAAWPRGGQRQQAAQPCDSRVLSQLLPQDGPSSLDGSVTLTTPVWVPARPPLSPSTEGCPAPSQKVNWTETCPAATLSPGLPGVAHILYVDPGPLT